MKDTLSAVLVYRVVGRRETEEEALENIKDAIKADLNTVIQSCLDPVEELTENSECRYVKVGELCVSFQASIISEL